jgi:hypothetical protein
MEISGMHALMMSAQGSNCVSGEPVALSCRDRVVFFSPKHFLAWIGNNEIAQNSHLLLKAPFPKRKQPNQS